MKFFVSGLVIYAMEIEADTYEEAIEIYENECNYDIDSIVVSDENNNIIYED